MKVNKNKLQKSLQKVQPGLADKDIIEQSTSFIFQDGDLLTYNDVISVRTKLDLGFNGAVKAEELLKLLARTKLEEVDVSAEKNELILKAKKLSAGIKMTDQILLPIDNISFSDDWEKLPKNFKTGLKLVRFCTSKDMSNPITTHICCRKKKMLATDTFRITSFKLSSKFSEDILISYEVANHLISYDFVEYQKENNWLHFRDEDGLIFSCRTISDEFPKVSKLLKMDGIEFVFPKLILDIIERCQVFSSTEFQQDEFLTFDIKRKKISISAKNEGGWIRETSKIDYKGESFSFMISPEFLKQIVSEQLHTTVGGNTIKFETDQMVHLIRLFGETK